MSYFDMFASVVTVVLFVILGYKIMQNRKLMRGTSKPAGKSTAEEFMHEFVDQPALWIKLAKGLAPASPEEDASMSLMVEAAYQNFEAQFAEYEAGDLDDDGILAFKESIKRIHSMPGVQRYWKDIKAGMSQTMISFIEND